MRVIFTTYNTPLSLVITKKGKVPFAVDFTCPVINGTMLQSSFTTSDAEEIELIKASKLFGSVIFVKSEEKDDPVQQKEAEEPKENNLTPIPDVNSIAKAQHWNQSVNGELFTAKTVKTVKEEAASKYNVYFPDWK